MPRKHYRKRPRRRRRRKKNRRDIRSIIVRGPSAFPDRVYVRLRYTNSFALAFAGINDIVFSGNAPQAPDILAVEQQPRGFREWMSVYGLVKAHKSSIKVDFLNLDNASALDCVILPHVQISPSFLDTEDVREQPYAKSKRVSPRGGNATLATVYNTMKTKVVFGQRFIDDNYAGTVDAVPNERWFWTVYVQNLTNDTGTVNCDISVSLTYWVEFYQREILPRSVSPT